MRPLRRILKLTDAEVETVEVDLLDGDVTLQSERLHGSHRETVLVVSQMLTVHLDLEWNDCLPETSRSPPPKCTPLQ